MIQKICLSIVKNTSNKKSKMVELTHIDRYMDIPKPTSLQKNSIAKIQRFFTELKNETKAVFRKILKKEELPKAEKSRSSKITYSAKQQQELEEQARQRNMVKWRKEDSEKQIKSAHHDPKPGDIDSNGYLTCSGKDKVNHPNFKGVQDDLNAEHNIEKNLAKEHDVDAKNINVEDKYTDMVYGKHTQDIEPHSESSLLESLHENQIHRHHLEKHADDVVDPEHLNDVIERSHLDVADDLPDTLFD